MEIVHKIDRIIQLFNLDLVEYSDRYQGACPIHNGDNNTAFCIYKDSGFWRCFSLCCHEDYGVSLFGFTKGLLSVKHKKEISNEETTKFLDNLFGKEEYIPNDINNIFFNKTKTKETNITRDIIRQRLEIPAQYFIGRKFTAEVLDKYDVGLCTNKKSRFYNRCVAPIYDLDYKSMIGCSGRDITEKSKIKWLHSKFPRENTLYNSWFAKHYIKKTNTAILVESMGNVWKLEQADIHCGLGMFGTQLSFGQMRLLSKLGVLNLILLTDNDDAGKKAASKIVKTLKGLYNIIIPEINYEDVGECPENYLQDKLLPILEGL